MSNHLSRTAVIALYLSALGATSHAWCAQSGARPTAPTAKANVAIRSIKQSKLPLGFEPNRGQVNARVQFLSRGSGYDLFLTESQAVLSLQVESPKPHPVGVSMRLLGTTGARRAVGEQPLPGYVNYFEGSDPKQWRTRIETFSHVRYPNAYPGIDLVYYGNQGQLEYDFIVAPGADPSLIQLGFDGALPRIDAAGDLILSVAGRELRFENPVVYQASSRGRDKVDGRFVLTAKKEVRFSVGRYDHRRPLVIDPVLVYSSYLGGTTQETTISGMALNGKGEMFVTGVTNALDLPTTRATLFPECPAAANGTTKCGVSSQSSAFVSKISADGGSLLYSTYLGGDGATNGGEGADAGIAIAVDADDDAYVVGTTQSNNFPVSSDAYQSLCSPVAADFNFNDVRYEGIKAGCAGFNAGGEYVYGDPDVFLVKLNPAGSKILYGTFLGGSQNDSPIGVALDLTGNIYVSGSTSSANTGVFASNGSYNYPVTASAFQSLGIPGGFVSFLTVLKADGHSLLYSTVLGGSNIGATGNGTSGNFATALTVNPTTGIAYLAGFSSSATFPVTAGAFQATCPANPAGVCSDTPFIAALDPTKAGAASLLYSTRLNGTDPPLPTSRINGIAVDPAGSAYVTGTTEANDFPTTDGSLQPACSHVTTRSCNDAFVTKLNAAGTAAVWSTLYGSRSGCCTVSGQSIAVDADRNVYVAGVNGGAYDLLQTAPLHAEEHGGQDVFLLKLNAPASRVLFGSYLGGVGNDQPNGIAIDSSSNIFIAGQTTSADFPLSDNAFDTALSGGFTTGFVAKVSTGVGTGEAGAGGTDGLAGAGGAEGLAGAGGQDATGGETNSASAAAAGEAGEAGESSSGRAKKVVDSGCGCRLASREGPRMPLLIGLGLLLISFRRRSRTIHPRC